MLLPQLDSYDTNSILEFCRHDICSLMLKRLKNYHRPIFEHAVRVSSLCAELSFKLEMPEENREIFIRSALLHDVGLTRIDKQILDKPGALNQAEWNCIQNHCRYGVEILESGLLKPYVDASLILYHHENLDGTGYYGLKNEELSLGVRILRVADSYDAMTHPRNYHRPMTRKEAFEDLYCWNDIHYDASVVDALIGLQRKSFS